MQQATAEERGQQSVRLIERRQLDEGVLSVYHLEGIDNVVVELRAHDGDLLFEQDFAGDDDGLEAAAECKAGLIGDRDLVRR